MKGKTPGAGKNETEARLLHALGALLFHHSKFTGVPVSKLVDVVVMPTIENESIAKQVDMTQIVLRGEAQARKMDRELFGPVSNTCKHADKL